MRVELRLTEQSPRMGEEVEEELINPGQPRGNSYYTAQKNIPFLSFSHDHDDADDDHHHPFQKEKQKEAKKGMAEWVNMCAGLCNIGILLRFCYRYLCVKQNRAPCILRLYFNHTFYYRAALLAVSLLYWVWRIRIKVNGQKILLL